MCRKMYIVDILFLAEFDDGLDATNNVSIGHIFSCYFLHFVDQTLKVAQTVLSALNFIDYSHDSSLEGIVTFPVRNRYDFFFVNFPIGFSNLAVRRANRFSNFKDGFLDSCSQIMRSMLRQRYSRWQL